MEVKVRDGQVDKALKILKRKMQNEGVFRVLREKEFHEKPSDKRRRKKKEAVKRLQKSLRQKEKIMGLHGAKSSRRT